MALQSSGEIEISDVNVELGNTATDQLNLDNADVRDLFDVPTGEIALSDGYGKSAVYNIDNSLRFDSASSAHLTWTAGTATDRNKWTMSFWHKMGNIPSADTLIMAADGSNFQVRQTGNKWLIRDDYLGGSLFTADMLFRDPSAWYHFVIVWDTDQGTSTDRIKFYINGTRTTGTWNTTVSSGANSAWNNASKAHALMNSNGGSSYVDGYLAEVNFIDGQAKAPADFGETGDYGEWKPIEYTGTYGTNGFYLDFADSADLGNDVSGEGNDWTTNNLAATDQMLDTPTNNFCTMTPLTNGKHGGNVVFSQGNLRVAITGDNFQRNAYSTFNLPKTGKWYWEVYVEAGDSSEIGIIEDAQDYQISDDWSFIGNGWAYAGYNGKKIDHGPSTTWGNSYGNTDLISVAVDMDNSKIWWAKNGTWQVSGNPSTGANAAYTNVSGNVSPAVGDNSSVAHTTISNFGQDSSFAGNKTAQGNTDGNGYGDFYYEPPTGFNALCTQNLPNPAVIPSEHFNVKLFTGNGGTNTTDVGFAADLVW